MSPGEIVIADDLDAEPVSIEKIIRAYERMKELEEKRVKEKRAKEKNNK